MGKFGGPEVIKILKDVALPTPNANEVIIFLNNLNILLSASRDSFSFSEKRWLAS